jgi:glycosyltransferase involved in cell wall biosynthesis/peptidoglycan/xylan/chitin deacetylase (PgdA/CDA1 family)
MKVSVVIPTYNRRPSLERCLASLRAQQFPFNEYEIVVVSDGCTDDTAELLRGFQPSCKFQWFEQQNQGAAAAQNRGVFAATGEVILFVDDDCICDQGLLAAHYESHQAAEKLVVIGPLTLHPESPPGVIHAMMKELEDAEFRRLSTVGPRRSDLMLCANSSVARHAALACPFDPTYKRIHDVEAGIRLWEKGYRPHFAPKAKVHEYYTKSASDMIRDSRNQGRFEVILTASHAAFKPQAAITRINEGNAFRRMLRKQLARHWRPCEFLLRPLYALADFFQAIPFSLAIAKRLLHALAGIAHLRGAIQEAGSWRKLEQDFGVRVPAIMYHNVGSPVSGEYPGLTTPTHEFEKQIRFLAKMGYKGIEPTEWLYWRETGASLPERPVILVFDDAYAEACHNAFPILERYGFNAACMVVTGSIGKSNRWDEQSGRPSFQLMSKREILDWSQRGIEFGGHTRDHSELPLVSDDEVNREVAACKQDLTDLLGSEPRSFAYPFGGVSPVAQAAARRHFDMAFTVWPGILNLATDPHLVPRISFLPGETRFGMWCRLRLGKNPYEVLRRRLIRLGSGRSKA